MDYNIADAIVGTAGVSLIYSGGGTDTEGNEWRIKHILTTRDKPDPAGPCLAGQTQVDGALRLTVNSGGTDGNVVYVTGPSCFTTAGFLQNTLQLEESVLPKKYAILATSGTLPATAKIGSGGVSGVWKKYDDTDFDGVYRGGAGDIYTGSNSATWKLEDQQGTAALVFSSVSRDENGVLEASEIDTYYLTPSGKVTGFQFVLNVPQGPITLTGTVTYR
jgi:hypothetical protein